MTAHTATISRTELGMSSLSLQDTTYAVMNNSINGGVVQWRREVAVSPYVAGETEIGSVKDQVRSALTIRVTAGSHAALQTAVSTLVSAFSQKSYTLTLGFDGVTYAWTCGRADYSIAFDEAMRLRSVARCTFVLPRSPVPASGPY